MDSVTPLQKILFGSPGTGKSFQIRTMATGQLGMQVDPVSGTLQSTIKTVFHPEYTHADFLGKLMPQTQGNQIVYKFYPGHFLQALGMAYRSIMNRECQHHLLVIDELNRGNAAAIFGSVFQLLDRGQTHWSSYDINISDLEFMALLNLMGYKTTIDQDDITIKSDNRSKIAFDIFFKQKENEFRSVISEFVRKKRNSEEVDSYDAKYDRLAIKLSSLLSQGKISIPPNLSILATINTSDESIYYLDSAFKRRWDWEYVEAPNVKSLAPASLKGVKLEFNGADNAMYWTHCIVGINKLIIENSRYIRRIEDKQIGWWFVKPENNSVSLQQVKNKIMFYLWDNVLSKIAVH